MKIYFYIRSLYKDNISPFSEIYRNNKRIELFNSVSPITAQEYREKIHNIQLKCLGSISENIIYNTPSFTKELYEQPYYNVQATAKNKLLELHDDDVVVPLDDDDWISPDITSIPFEPNTITVWNTAWFNGNFKLVKFRKNHQFGYNELFDQKLSVAFSNCFAISASIIKTFISSNKRQQLNQLLQYHQHTRTAVYEFSKTNNFKENVLDDYYAIYVKHICNDTNFKLFFKDENNPLLEEYVSMISSHQKINYNTELLAQEFKWSLPYVEELIELNNKFYLNLKSL